MENQSIATRACPTLFRVLIGSIRFNVLMEPCGEICFLRIAQVVSKFEFPLIRGADLQLSREGSQCSSSGDQNVGRLVVHKWLEQVFLVGLNAKIVDGNDFVCGIDSRPRCGTAFDDARDDAIAPWSADRRQDRSGQ